MPELQQMAQRPLIRSLDQGLCGAIVEEKTRLVSQPQATIRNIAELMSALAVDWSVPGRRRTLYFWPSASFVRTATGDIAVDGGPYSMSGFIRFETQYMFAGMFETENSKDGENRSASLTARGVEFAKLNVLDYHEWGASVRCCAFFWPPAADIHPDRQLAAPVRVSALR